MLERENTADIAVIGGGIIGLCTALYLAMGSAGRIVLLEKNLLAQASTGLSVGGIRQQFSHPSNIRLTQMSLRLLSQFEERFQTDLGFQQTGYLFLAEKISTLTQFKENVALQQKFDVPVELLLPAEITARWPFLNISMIRGGTYCARDGFADPYHVAMAYARAARNLGVGILENTQVHQILTQGGRVYGLETSRGRLTAPIVINTAGAWAAEIAASAGLSLPIKPYRRQVYVTTRFKLCSPPLPLTIFQDALFYFRREGEGILMGMSDPREPSSFHTHTDRAFLESLIETATQRVPDLAQAEMLRGWGGLYAITPDENPILGGLGEIEGLFGAIGFSGHGFQHGPAAGHLLSELIIQGHTDFDLAPFAYSRFGKPGHPGEQRTV